VRADSGASKAVQASKGEVDVLLKGIGEKSVANDVKNVLEMVLYCFSPLSI
jgi:hypothetical protein